MFRTIFALALVVVASAIPEGAPAVPVGTTMCSRNHESQPPCQCGKDNEFCGPGISPSPFNRTGATPCPSTPNATCPFVPVADRKQFVCSNHQFCSPGAKQCVGPTGSNGRDPTGKVNGPCDATTAPCQDNTTVCDPLTKQCVRATATVCVPASVCPTTSYCSPKINRCLTPVNPGTFGESRSTVALLRTRLSPPRLRVNPPFTNVRLECHVGAACATGTISAPDVNECVTVGDWCDAP